jgi:hypothetical protein
MTFVVSAAAGPGPERRRFHLVSPAGRAPAELDHVASVVPGLELGWSPADPRRWSGLRISAPDLTEDALTGLLGESGAGSCLAAVRTLDSTGASGIEVTGPIRPEDADRAWLRLAATEFLDRWLYLPLDQSLVDAEIAAAHLAAAEGVPPGSPARSELLARALRRARAASAGTADYLDRLARPGRTGGRPPAKLIDALRRLVLCYLSLGERVGEFDAALAAVPEAWVRLTKAGWSPAEPEWRPTETRRPGTEQSSFITEVSGGAAEASQGTGRSWNPGAVPLPRSVSGFGGQTDRGASFVDPRQLPARVVRLGASPLSAEIDLRQKAGEIRVRVRVAGCPPNRPDPPAESRLLARLISRKTGVVTAHGLLRAQEGPAEQGERHLEGVLPRPSGRWRDVRADVYDVFSEVPPARSDRDQGLHRARRAVHFLRGWRSLVAEVQLGLAVRPAQRLGHLAQSLTPPLHDAERPDQALWRRGPSASVLEALAAAGDVALTEAIRRGEALGGPAAPFLAASSGPGALLAAELAAAYDADLDRRQVT